MTSRHMVSRLLLGAAVVLASAMPAAAAVQRLKGQDSFRIGNSGVLCTAQAQSVDPLLTSMFDRGYAIVCRDAATSVGKLYALRSGTGAAASAKLSGRGGGGVCAAPESVTLGTLAGVQRRACAAPENSVPQMVFSLDRGGTLYIAEGFAGYEQALALGLQSLVADRALPGALAVTSTGGGDPTALARVQAGTLDPEQALAEGYVRNNAGSFAEASVFFETLVERARTGSTGFDRTAEYLANQGLQQSNLGNPVESAALFERAAQAPDAGDPVQQRRLRNFRAIDALNYGRAEAALEILNTSVSAATNSGLRLDRLAEGFIDRPVAQRLSTDSGRLERLSGGEQRLTDPERIAILDAQTLYLRGVAYRATGRAPEARAALADATAAITAIRGGRVRSMTWLNAASLTELSLLDEAAGNAAGARANLEEATRLLATDYPSSAVLLSARARLAALLARQGQDTAALAAYGDVIRATPDTPGGAQAIRPLIAPYFALLAARGGPADVEAFFDASQTLVRPGVAQTQAMLARELSGGSDEAAGLFRESRTVSREIIRAETDIARLTAQTELSSDDRTALEDATERRQMLAVQQTQLLAKLAAFPRYRVVAAETLKLQELQAKLKPGEAYYKLALVDSAAYGLFIQPDAARIVKVEADVPQLETMVTTLRDSIVRIENGQTATYPFDAGTARTLYKALFGGVEAAMPQVSHLVFEPDGALLQLPINLLIADDAGLPEFLARVADVTADAYDMRGISWLGRSRMVTTAVSPRSFVDLRGIAHSSATRTYLGLGQNAAPPANITAIPREACEWPLAAWANPISANELQFAATALRDGNGNQIVTESDFTDSSLATRSDLNQYRILHFATHGLVTAPAPQCSAQPALLTSFGAVGSDGLLTFKEIFDLRLDAETVILSACDTAGMATVSATREAGISTGGNFALDGLVRAFVGAGSRTVVASHWPVPDDYGATERLVTGLFKTEAGVGVGEAMRRASAELMDAADTSHPYYWSAFAIVGDGARPLQ